MNSLAPNDLPAFIAQTLRELIDHSPDNTLKNAVKEKAWDDFLLGFASGADPLWAWLKNDIGSFLWTPEEIFNLTFPKSPAAPEELTVVSWILPQRKVVKDEQRRADYYPGERWARVRRFGEGFNVLLRRRVAEALTEAGFAAVAPMISPLWSHETSTKYGFASNWSERHAAFVAGLGTFGLCDGLITPKGKAMRAGSVVVRAEIAPTQRPYKDHHAYCLFYTDGSCGDCIDRCPVGAVSKAGHDKIKCDGHTRGTVSAWVRQSFDFEVDACGLCQVGVPCESGIPVKE